MQTLQMHIASPSSARISMNNLPRAMASPLFSIGRKASNPVISHNDAKVIKMLNTTSEKLYTADQMAHKLGISTSYVYAKLSKLQAQPSKKEGKQAFYSGALLADMGERQRRIRRTVKQVQPLELSQPMQQTTPKEASAESLLTRIANLETELKKLQGMQQGIEGIKKLLGVS